jgi:hypothetical protein
VRLALPPLLLLLLPLPALTPFLQQRCRQEAALLGSGTSTPQLAPARF